jgi:cobalt/nickel transport system permease protein
VHIPDGFLSLPTAAGCAVAAAAAVGLAARQVRRTLAPRQVPLMGLTATFVFAAQMLNFPVAGGTSGHLLGACLTAVLIGPWATVLVLTAVLVVQCLVFADGGLLALGANVLNMAVLGGLVAGGLQRLLRRFRPGLQATVTAAAFASWASVVLAAAACAAELAVSGTVRAGVVIPAMVLVHMLIGVGEAVITALVLVSIAAIRPDLVLGESAPRDGRRRIGLVPAGLLLAFALAAFVSPIASSLPDGLDRVAERLGFARHAAEGAAPFAGYSVPFLSSPFLGTAVAGVIGCALMLPLSALLGWLLTARSRSDASVAGTQEG